jgi:signal transduction histidine kinase
MLGGASTFYDGSVLRNVAEYLGDRIRARGELIPLGYSWTFAVTVDATMAIIVVVATLQRPYADLGMCLLAIAIAIVPDLAFFFSGIKFRPSMMWLTSMAAAAIFLFATSTPIPSDFAPLMLVLMVGAAVALSPPLMGVLATGSAALVLVGAAQLHRLEGLAIYLPVLGMGWLVGFLMQTQRRLMVKQEEAQAALAEHAVGDERRRIAREVHDVIAHSLSVTMLHLTGARRALQQDRDIDDAVDALEDAERLGRQAMADIRRTVGLLDGPLQSPLRTAPEPDVDDIAVLVDDFVRAGLAVRLQIDGPTERVSPAEGLALYRIAQESLANIAKHAPESEPVVMLHITRSTAELSVVNQLPVTVSADRTSPGRGLHGMRQRVELLGGAIDVGPSGDTWSVRASIPLHDGGSSWIPWCTA